MLMIMIAIMLLLPTTFSEESKHKSAIVISKVQTLMDIIYNLWYYLKTTLLCSHENESNVPQYILSTILKKRVIYSGKNDLRVVIVVKLDESK